jgi:hypothetical protein
MRRFLTEHLRDPGSDRAQCSAPLPPPRCRRWGRQQRGLGGPRPVVLRRRVHCGVDAAPVVGVVVAVGGRRRGWAGRLAEFLVGVRRTSIEAGRYKAGWTRLSAGGRKRRVAASVAGPPVPGAGGELGRGGRRQWPGTGQPRCGCPPVAFRKGGSLLPPLVDRHVPVDGNGLDGAWGLEVEEYELISR